jgi:anthranilate synthase component 2
MASVPPRRRRILLVDCFDSFSWNVVGLLRDAGARVDVVRSDRALVTHADRTRPDLVVLSPGPGRPTEYPRVLDLLDRRLGRLAFLGVCLGMQALGEVAGAAVVRAPAPRHGKTSPVRHDGGAEFRGVRNPFRVMRYHSLRLDEATLPSSLGVAARSADDGVVMAVRHRVHDAFGVQFHPESFGTPVGGRLIANLLASPRAS